MQPFKVWLFSDLIEKNKRVFKVPVYQRNYDWSNLQCEKLYKDIIKAFERDHKHFMGTVVYIVGLNASTLNEVLIIDGQQRITTMYILLKALYDLSKGVSTRIEAEIEEVMFNRNCDEKYKLKLKPVKSDNEQLNLLIKDKIDEMDRNSNIYKNYITFKNLIINTNSTGLELSDILYGIKKLEMVEIVLDHAQGDEPQKIFESINSTGLELSLADLIRNFLLMDDINQEVLYEDYWCEVEKNVGYNNLGDFVINFLNSEITKSVNTQNAYRLFKEHCYENNFSHEDILQKLKKTSKYYGAFVGLNHTYSKKILKYLEAFSSIKQTTILPLLFRVFSDFEDKIIDETTLCNVLNYLLTYLVRITSCEINKNLSKFMKSMYDRVINDKYDKYYEKFVIFLNDLRANNRMPTDKEFEEALIYKPLYKKPICKFILSIIENSSKEHIDISNLTIEHILPQKENAALWKKEVGEDYASVYEIFLHTLGNLTITGHNSELGTKPFNEKKKIISDNSKANILNKEVLSASKWDKNSIVNRAKALSTILVEEFNYVLMHSDIIETNEITIDVNSSVDFSNTKPNGFSFVGEFTKVSSWADLLTKFINQAYELDSLKFNQLATNDFTIQNATNIYLTNDERKLNRPRQIENSSIFYETKLASNTIISFVKSIIYEMNLDSEDFSFSLAEVPFNIDDEQTWLEGMIPLAKLFYLFLEDLIIKSKITVDEIEKLKTKDYTKSLFNDTDYPAIANQITDNMGNSSRKRYRTKALVFNSKEIFISTQFFDSDREAVINWYKEHC